MEEARKILALRSERRRQEIRRPRVWYEIRTPALTNGQATCGRSANTKHPKPTCEVKR